MSVLSARHIDIVFGDSPQQALKLLDEGKDRLQIKELTGQTLGVSNATIQINEGDILVLMGQSGSGKSSLLRAFNGLNSISRGEICFNDTPVTDFIEFRRNTVSMVFQQAALLPWRNVFDNVALGLEIKKKSRTTIKQIVQEKLECVGLENWADAYPDELSGGMQQRVGIARAIATQTPILLMDEPFSALDPLTRSSLQKEVLRLQKEFSKTIVFVTHDLSEALELGTQIAIMEEGEIIQIGSPEEITQQPKNEVVKNLVNNAQNHCPRCQHQTLD